MIVGGGLVKRYNRGQAGANLEGNARLSESFVTPPRLAAPPTELPVSAFDVVVIGSGLAGLRAAVEAAGTGARVLVVAKRGFRDTNSEYAQGGIAAVTTVDDTVDEHVADTIAVSEGLSDESRVRILAEEGVLRVQELLDWGARFDLEEGQLALAREAGHSRARILRAGGDATGRELQSILLRTARAVESIEWAESSFLVDLVGRESTVGGVLLFDKNRGYQLVVAPAVILATGGLGQVYRETTNPGVATGDGLAAAFRAGAKLVDLEMIQFHPTTLYVAGSARNLISEAVRGEGAFLRDRDGIRFMPDVHPDAELAPRDVVSRAVLARMRETDGACVTLDLTHLGGEAMKRRFPGLAQLTARFGLDIGRDLIPVHPSAHYSIGGLEIDDAGRTSIDGLYACGEAAGSGVHGANRLASNSLLECIVFGARSGAAACADAAGRPALEADPVRLAVQEGEAPVRVLDSIERGDLLNSIRSLTWRCVGVERDRGGLRAARDKLAFWSRYVLDHPFPTPSGWEVQNVLTVAALVTEAAFQREESRGVHYRSDCPCRDDGEWRKRVRLARGSDGRIDVDFAPVRNPADRVEERKKGSTFA